MITPYLEPFEDLVGIATSFIDFSLTVVKITLFNLKYFFGFNFHKEYTIALN